MNQSQQWTLLNLCMKTRLVSLLTSSIVPLVHNLPSVTKNHACELCQCEDVDNANKSATAWNNNSLIFVKLGQKVKGNSHHCG